MSEILNKDSHNFEENATQEVNEDTENASDNLEKVQSLEDKVQELNNKLLRSLADLDNFRKRSREELEKTSKYAISKFLGDLVLITENFFLATENKPNEEIEKNPLFKNFSDAVGMTKTELMKLLEKNSVKRIYPIGEKFDHNLHEAMSHVESDKENNTIVQVIQAGYLISDRLIKPALVTVAKNK
jgi:molecular chaperone GrpE